MFSFQLDSVRREKKRGKKFGTRYVQFSETNSEELRKFPIFLLMFLVTVPITLGNGGVGFPQNVIGNGAAVLALFQSCNDFEGSEQ